MATTRDTVMSLSKSILTKLENRAAIEMPAEARQKVADEVFGLIGSRILTDQDLRERTLDKLGAAGDRMDDSQLREVTESERYRVAKKMVRESFGDNELRGLYFQTNLKEIAGQISKYLMKSPNIDEVYASDDELEKTIVEIIQKFNPADLH